MRASKSVGDSYIAKNRQQAGQQYQMDILAFLSEYHVSIEEKTDIYEKNQESI